MSDTPRTEIYFAHVNKMHSRDQRMSSEELRLMMVTAFARQLERELNELKSAAQTMLDKYTKLADSGDAGHWNPEEETHVINLRRALNLWKE